MTATSATFNPTRKNIATLRSFALALTSHPSEADDLVQDSLVRATRFWSKYDESKGSVIDWLRAIMRNVHINRRHSQVRRTRHTTAYAATARATHIRPDHMVPEVAVAKREIAERVHAAVDSLPEKRRELVRLVDLQGASYSEAANALGCPIGTVMSGLYRARHSMHAALAAVAG